MKPVPPEGNPKPATCPVCAEAFERKNLVLCQSCSQPHHKSCWTYNKGCATYACSCRTSVPPPISQHDEVDFVHRGEPNLPLIIGSVLIFLTVIFGGGLLLPKAIFKAIMPIVMPIFIIANVGGSIFPLLFETRYRFLPYKGRVSKDTLFLGKEVRSLPEWKSTDQIEELEVETGWSIGQQPTERRRNLKVMARFDDGEEIELERVPWTDREPLLLKLEGFAHALDTVVSLPQEMTGTQKLPPGLPHLLESLPPPEEELEARLLEEASAAE